MTWIDTILDRCPPQVVINDSKTPSGLAHVGSLRGVLIHDALLRAARRRGMDARFIYGCDDMDPVDEIPHGTGEHFREFLGVPLFRAPPPPDLPGDSMAGAYFAEFTSTFGPLGVDADFYFMSELYRSGRLDETIDAFLRAASTVRDIYRRETGSVRSPDWLPFQPICEECGRIGTTHASDYDGETVAYECRPDLVEWAEGCGNTGRRSPFGGNGKLPWKLEWAAKWKVFAVSLEGAGKDHMGAGGSHKVASALAREVLKRGVPASFSYEFFTLAGAKMSSSKGIGATAGELAAILPPELLRYLVLRVQPRKAVDFALDVAGVTRAFAEYERLWRTHSGSGPAQQQIFALSQPAPADGLEAAPGYSPPVRHSGERRAAAAHRPRRAHGGGRAHVTVDRRETVDRAQVEDRRVVDSAILRHGGAPDRSRGLPVRGRPAGEPSTGLPLGRVQAPVCSRLLGCPRHPGDALRCGPCCRDRSGSGLRTPSTRCSSAGRRVPAPAPSSSSSAGGRRAPAWAPSATRTATWWRPPRCLSTSGSRR